MNILFAGDIVGRPGREAVATLVPKLKVRYKLDFVIANGENAAGGSGITPKVADDLFAFGVDVLTSGDHIWKRKELYSRIDKDNRILRPANFPSQTPGNGFGIFSTKSGVKIGVMNLCGRIFMSPIDCPFQIAKQNVEKIRQSGSKIIIVDIHAEATSEKQAIAWLLDGQVSAVVGTHTHVQTADERIFPQATAYITDVGMTGPHDSILGRRSEQILERFITSMPIKFQIASDNVQLQGVIITINPDTGKAEDIKRIQEKL